MTENDISQVVEVVNELMPKQLENLKLPNPALVTYYKNLGNRVLWLDSDLDENWMEFVRNIARWNIEDIGLPVEERTPIKLFVNSYGGMVDVCFSMIDAIKLSKTKVIGINVGVAFSGGAFTFLACHEKLAFPHSSILLHSGSANDISGTAQQVQEFTAQYKKQIDALKDFLVDECGLNKGTVTKKMKSEWYVSPQEAVELGIVDKIIESFDELA